MAFRTLEMRDVLADVFFATVSFVASGFAKRKALTVPVSVAGVPEFGFCILERSNLLFFQLIIWGQSPALLNTNNVERASTHAHMSTQRCLGHGRMGMWVRQGARWNGRCTGGH